MISSIWTLQAASGGDEKTLAGWGVSSASISSRTQSPDVLSLSLPVADAVAMSDLWPWETEVILRRDGDVYYRGYLASHPRSLSATSESVELEFRSHWWLLERLTYRQNWSALTGSTLGPVATGRVALARDAETPDAAAMLSELSDFCTSMGVALTIDLTDFDDMELPLIEGHNRTVAELIREILRWFPGVTLVPVYGEEGTTYRILSPGSDDDAVLTLDGDSVTDLSIAALPEMQVDAVQILYETTAQIAEWEEPGEDVIGGFTASRALVAATDTYPVDAEITRRSLVLTLPHPQLPPDPVPQVLRQPVVARLYPENGATDSAAETWWLDRSGLGSLGLTSADIVLPPTSTETVFAHRVILDPATPPEFPPSPVNPESTPVWSPDEIGDTPRELVAGSLSDWMRVESAPAIAEVTIGIKTTAVAALDSVRRAAFLRMGPRQGTVSSTPAWLLDATYRFTATDALTKTYVKTVSVDYGDVDDEERAAEVTEASYTAAVSAAVVPGLARRLYDELSVLRYQGSARLSAAEVPATQYLGRRLLINHDDRAEWSTMEARIQSVAADILTGTLALSFGPPKHLAPQDWVELHESARKMRERRTDAAASPQTEPDEDEAPTSGQIGTTILPTSNFQFPSGSTATPQMWDLVPIPGGDTWQCWNPRILSSRTDITATVTISGNSFTPAAGDWIVATMTGLSAAAIEMLSTWSGYPSAYTFSADTMTHARIPLWRLVGTEETGAIFISDGVWALRFVGTGALRAFWVSESAPSSGGITNVIDLV